jgi:ABC-type uncharacterized transport system permease subunit
MLITTVHIGFSVLAVLVSFAVVTLAVVYGFLEYGLRAKEAPKWLNCLPSLADIDGVLWRCLWGGFALLTIVLVSGVYLGFFKGYLPALLAQGKVCLALSAWGILLGALWLYHYRGWRGFNASLVLGCLCLLVLVVFKMSFSE